MTTLLQELLLLAEEKMEDHADLKKMIDDLKKAGFKDVEQEGNKVHFTRETPKSSDTFTLWHSMEGKKCVWALGVQGNSQDLEVTTDLENLADVKAAVKSVNKSWFKENDPDWDG